jgi:hypothetical protein
MPFRLRLACVVLILLFAALHATAAPIQTKGSPSTQSKGSPTKANVKASTVANNGSKLGKGGSKCGGNQIAGPCIYEDDVSGLPGIGIRDANNIGKLCETRTLAYVYVNPDDQSSATTGDLEILTAGDPQLHDGAPCSRSLGRTAMGLPKPRKRRASSIVVRLWLTKRKRE